MAIVDGRARESSLAAEPELGLLASAVYHRACFPPPPDPLPSWGS